MADQLFEMLFASCKHLPLEYNILSQSLIRIMMVIIGEIKVIQKLALAIGVLKDKVRRFTY